jgi:hypothetical protein
MIAHIVTDAEGNPIDGNGNKLAVSSYNPPEDIKKLFARVQTDYQTAWRLQHRGFDEFDGYSLLERAKMDQQTFGAYVGAIQEPLHKAWRWKGRKNTARNKVIGILAHMISGMLYPMCHAYNEENEEDKMTAKVMRILIENHLKKADYEMKFLFMVTSALVNPAVFVEIEFVEAIQRIKVRNADGTYRVEEAVDELLSGINLNILPIDQILLADFYTFDLQRQPNIPRVRRISYDEAKSIYAGKYFIDGKDQFDFVEAGKTRIMLTGQEHQTLYDIEWTEADANYVQVITLYYRSEDLEVTFVGGVFMGNHVDVYNSNPFKHRRMSMIGDKFLSIPVYPFAKTGFEPLDPNGRFAYYKSACFKLFWDALGDDRMHQIAYDGTYLDVFKPMFLSGVDKVDSTVMVPGATIGMPPGANATAYSLGPNLQAALNMMRVEQEDMAESTQDKALSGITEKGVTAYAVSKAEQNAKVILGVFAVMIGDLVRQVGELVIDDIIIHTTIGEVDAQAGVLNMKYKTIMVEGKDGGKDVTNKIDFSTDIMGKSKEDLNKMEWDMFEKAGGVEASQRIYKVNPYRFARTKFALYIDPEMIISRSMGTDQLKKERAFNLLTDPRVAPYVDQQAVVDKFVLEEYSDGNPDEFKKKPGDLLSTVMGQQPGAPGAPQAAPAQSIQPQMAQ